MLPRYFAAGEAHDLFSGIPYSTFAPGPEGNSRMSWWVHEYYQAGLIALLISHIFWVIFSITLHELAHGWAAIWQGDRTPILLGHMNMNPMVHMGPMSLLMFAIVGIAWGAMPVDPSRFRWRRKGRIVVSGAGPAMNLALTIVCVLMMTVWMKIGPQDQPVYQHLTTFFFAGAELNVVLLIFNLLPVPPLDGSDILSGFSMGWYRMMHQTNAPMIGMFVVLALMISGVLAFLWSIGYSVAAGAGNFLGAMAGNPTVENVLGFAY